jgi:hypothetical protein
LFLSKKEEDDLCCCVGNLGFDSDFVSSVEKNAVLMLVPMMGLYFSLMFIYVVLTP